MFTGKSGLIVAVAVLLRSTSIPMFAFADDKSPDAPTLSVIDNRIEYVAKAKQAETQHDYNDAITWYQKAANLGDAKSMNELGWIYFGAHDIPGRQLKDYPKAAIWFQKAADLNYVPAITQLGVMYNSDGHYGVPEDHVKAAELFLIAAQAGDAQAMDNLGVMYFQGKGVPRRDSEKAVYWWKRSVEADKNGTSGKAAQSWLDMLDGKPWCLYCAH